MLMAKIPLPASIRSWWALRAFFITVCGIIVALLTPSGITNSLSIVSEARHIISEKIVHFSIFFTLTCMLFITFRLKIYHVILVVVAFAIGSELVQPFFDRANEISDLYADGIGILFAFLLKIAIDEYRAEQHLKRELK